MPRERRLALIERLGAWGMLDRYHLFHAARADITAGATQIGAEPESF
jgi:predicted RNA polymerase sigma factor